MDNVIKNKQGDCQICDRTHHFSKTVADFKSVVFLYFIGVVELIRQLLVPFLNRYSRLQSDNAQGINHIQENGVILLTGASSGVGRALRQHLKQQAKHIILLLHPKEVDAAGDDDYVTIDLASKEATETSCSNLVTLLENSFPNLPVLLVHAAGVYNPPCEKPSSELSELNCSAMKTLVINTIMPCLLLDRLRNILSGVVLIGSSSQWAAPRMSLSQCPLDMMSSPRGMYPISKMLALFSLEAWCEVTGKPALVVHPGVVQTRLYHTDKSFLGTIIKYVVPYTAWKPEISADKVAKVMKKAGIYDVLRRETSNKANSYSSNSIYWDTVTMKPQPLPSHFPDRRERVLFGKRLFLTALAWK